MINHRIAFATLASLSIAGAAAKEEWKTVTLRGEPGLTISIPAVADNEAKASDPSNLMFFSVEAGLHGSLTCMAIRFPYDKGTTREALAAKLATEHREVFCGDDKKTVSGMSIHSSKSFERNGSQGAVCTASYTDSAEKLPGRVESQLVIAAPDKVYLQTCIGENEDQFNAEYDWNTLWEEKVRHIQDSFHLPE